jgi:serine/threonine protein kinase/tetratricopeptide (TPR) repeat protein
VSEADFDESPEQIGPYRVLQVIARGGSGKVFEVEDPSTGEHLALKLLMHEQASFVRFYREYEAMARLNHPNIIRVYHFGMFGRMPWQTMELVTGTPVQPYVMRKGRPGDPVRIDEAIRLGHDIAGALHHVHRRGLVHRDLKSANLLVLPDGRIKLIDFGSARVLDGVPLTREGDFIGTFAYASPEQILGKRVDGRSDLYSLGILLYRLCTGRRPFEEDDPHTLAKMHLETAPTPPIELYPKIPERLSRLIVDLLAKKPDDRPRSGKQVARELEAIAGRPLILPGTLEIEDSANRLIGREPQQQALRGLFQRQEPGSLAIISGRDGSGETPLLTSLATEARRDGASVIRSSLSEGRDFLALHLALRQILESIPDSADEHVDRARSFLDMIGHGADLRLPGRRQALHHASATLFASLAKQNQKPVLYLIEDLHHAQPLWREWLVEVRKAVATTKAPVLFAASFDPTKDHALLPLQDQFADALWVHLDALDAHQVGLLVGALLHRRPPPPAMADRIHQASGGLPAYVEEVVQALVQQGLLKERGQDSNRLEWAQANDLPIPIPQRAQRTILDAFTRLPAVHRRTLEVLAHLDDSATVLDVATGLGWTPEEVFPILQDLAERAWLTLSQGKERLPDRAVRWCVLLSRDVIADRVPQTRRTIIHQMLSRSSMVVRPSPRQIQLLIDTDQIPHAVLSAIEQSETLLAAGLPVSALNVLGPVVSKVSALHRISRESLARLYLNHARALVSVRPLDPDLKLSLKRAQSLGRGDEFGAEISMTLATLQRRIGHLDNYRKHLADAWNSAQHIEGDNPIIVHVTIELGFAHLRAGDLPGAHRWLHHALRSAESFQDQRLIALSNGALAHLRYARGEFRGALDHAMEALDHFERTMDADGLGITIPVMADTLRQQGRFSEGISIIRGVLPLFRQQENPSNYVNLLVSMAWLEVEMGRLGRAQECIDELGATVSSGEMLVLRLESRLAWGRILVASDQLRQAAQVLGEVYNLATTARLYALAEHARGLLAESLWIAGKEDEARTLYHRSIERLSSLGFQPALIDVCRSRGRVASAVIDPDALFDPIRDLLAREPAELARAEWLTATGVHLTRQGKDAMPVWQRTHALLTALEKHLDDVDRSALRVHPWSRLVRQFIPDPASTGTTAPPQEG